MEGINSRLDGLQAAILRVKLPHLQSWTDSRRRIAARYTELLAKAQAIELPKVADDCEHVYHLYVIRSNSRDSLKKHLSAAGI